MGRFINLTNEVFGKLTVKKLNGKTKRGTLLYEVLCSCGNTTIVAANNLRSGNTKSCGCNKIKHEIFVNGRKSTPTYITWHSMLTRCGIHGNDVTSYINRAGRNITVCDRWLIFSNFLLDMGERPVGTYIDRIDNDGDYTPGNCRWVSGKINSRNKRNNLLITHEGKTLCLAEWVDIFHPEFANTTYNIPGLAKNTYNKIYRRITGYKWEFLRAMTTP